VTPAATGAIGFRSAKELREVLDALMRAIDRDPEIGPKLRAAAAPLRFDFPDQKLSLTILASDRGCLKWDFKTKSSVRPRLLLRMDSDFANRLFQGRENPVIAMARGLLHTTVADAGAALRFFGSAKPLYAHYRRVVSEKFPHLTIE
jgi:hypothetical protein